MKKIGIYLQASPSCGGTYQYNQLWVDALAELPQVESIAVYRDPHWENYLKDKMPAIAVPKHRIWEIAMGLWRRLRLPICLWRKTLGKLHPLYKILQKSECDLWLFPSQDPFYWYDVPVIAVIHDLMHRFESQFEEVGNKAEYARREFHYQATARFAKTILVDSELGLKHLESCYPQAREKGAVLPYIAARDLCTRSKSSDFNEKYALPTKYLFYPAQFWKHKNHIRLLEAVSIARNDYPDLQLVLVGSPKNGYEEMKAHIAKLQLDDCVHIFGYVTEADLPEFYRRARALVMPTFFGPTNIPPLEAFALNCPAVVSDIYGMRAQSGDAAVYVDPKSVQDIAEKIKQVWVDEVLCQKLVLKGREHAERWNFESFKSEAAKIVGVEGN